MPQGPEPHSLVLCRRIRHGSTVVEPLQHLQAPRRPGFGVFLHRACTRAPFAPSSPHEHTQNTHAGKSAAAEPPLQLRALLRSLHRPTVALGGLTMPRSCSRTKPEPKPWPRTRLRVTLATRRRGTPVPATGAAAPRVQPIPAVRSETDVHD